MRENIKIAALKLFSENGFQGTTIKELAKECGLKPSSIYSHYTSKEELYVEVWKVCINRINVAISDIAINLKPENDFDEKEVLKKFFFRLIEFYSQNRQEYLFTKNTMLGHTLNQPLPKTTIIDFNKVSFYFGVIFSRLKNKKIISDIDNSKLTSMYITIILGYLEQNILFGINLEETDIEKIWNIFWFGIKNNDEIILE